MCFIARCFSGSPTSQLHNEFSPISLNSNIDIVYLSANAIRFLDVSRFFPFVVEPFGFLIFESERNVATIHNTNKRSAKLKQAEIRQKESINQVVKWL